MDIDEYEKMRSDENYQEPDDLKDPDFMVDTDEVEDDEAEDVAPTTDKPEDDDTETETEEDQKPETKDQPEPEEKPDKPVQTSEENAKFAEQRRQRMIQEALEASPEYKLAKQIAQISGKTTEQMMADLQEAEAQRIAEDQKIPIEHVRERQALARDRQAFEAEQTLAQFNQWKSRITSEREQLKKDFPILSDDELDTAENYLLTGLHNPDLPLNVAVNLLHSSKIDTFKRDQMKNEILAEQAGRKPGPLGTQGKAKGGTSSGLTAEQKYVAKQMNMTEADYKKWM